MKELTIRERYQRMYEHRDADRVPVIDLPWAATLERWQREGMPAETDFHDYFGLDRIVYLQADNSPRYPVKVIEETDAYKIYTSPWGVTLKNWKHMASTPEFVAHTIVDRPSWAAAKKRMAPDRDRIDWEYLKTNYPLWRRKGYWLTAQFWFGFDVTHSWTIGTERMLIALAEDPDWCAEMFNHYLDVHLALFEMMWDAGYTFDGIRWPDDMGYKYHQFFSLRTYREVLKPVHKRAIDWAHAKGIKAELHSCGDVNPFVPELIEIGLDSLNPLEVKAGMDTLELKKRYGRQLVFHGGINAVLWDKRDQIEAEMRAKLPALKAGGGYIFASDHSVPSTVSLEDFRHIVGLAKQLGAY